MRVKIGTKLLTSKRFIFIMFLLMRRQVQMLNLLMKIEM
ncbi:hypothetical protein E1A91_D13G238300v1 [Gossypium mustelinum]|uniref:Uncharacterized protein n=1 Tax=Gossypium mustelinum TaxID=34275 RepID=A0A5D2S735_GOSMU|nr:hypothetical protein E1A91_D13G238300v1 [Gossypium mustelinum]